MEGSEYEPLDDSSWILEEIRSDFMILGRRASSEIRERCLYVFIERDRDKNW